MRSAYISKHGRSVTVSCRLSKHIGARSDKKAKLSADASRAIASLKLAS